ncbi:feruloyl-CoA synthase [Pandoraea pulmonicola]|uniref:Feruloyl-CoA synthase n=1 Tax=Pandoraea pulmonicola TaxID=93221 RepID=A0AAJ5CZT1_PANPU|nr:feruloyl-CoA synthase [Pandoraea pulmonicola]AJC21342.1 feruloyl-CoA synthase [Pandoraea pulmonicola]SUA89933.1 Long-chain-fatty-acid--CoA ligase FadD15 [Pandoraea pulmonicola]
MNQGNNTAPDGHRYRRVTIGNPGVEVRRDGEFWYLRSREPLGDFPVRLTDRLVSGAARHPERWLVARRGPDGEWIGISYAQMLSRARAIGQALRDRGLSQERPIAILSGNDLEHFQLALGAMMAGVPFAPISPAYSIVSTDFGKLRHTMDLLQPGLVYASDASAYGRAMDAVLPDSVIRVSAQGGNGSLAFDTLLDASPRDIDAYHAKVDGDTVAKILFTSGSTRQPKAVPTTQRMLCSNQQMLLQTFPTFGEEPPVLVDWLPWNHTYGGSHNVGIALYNGGTLYIDDGKPVAGKFEETLRNLREISPTVYFNVPKGWEDLAIALESDAALRERFFARVNLYFFGGAGLSQAAWDRLERVTEAHCGERIRIMSGLGMTETSPSCMFTTGPIMRAGYIGLPAPGCEVKLAPVGGKLEVRFRGPNVMAGYWRHVATDPVFDEEGYYRTGDAATFVDAQQPALGLQFDGRLTEDFKLSSGTFVSVGPLRARVISEGAPYVQDAVVTGINRDDIGLLVFPRVEDCCRLSGLGADAPLAEVLTSPPVREVFTALLQRLNANAGGSATYVARLMLLDTPPSLDRGEITDKGSINQRAVQDHRASTVDALHAAQPGQTNDARIVLAPARR